MPQSIKLSAKASLRRRDIFSLLRINEDLLKRCMVKRIGLFGSYARGQQRQKSDVDFLVEFDEPTFDNFMLLSSSLERLLKKKVEIVTPLSLSPYMKPEIEKETRWHEVR